MSFAAAIAAAQQTAREATGGEITYARGTLTVTLTAGRGISTFEVQQGDILVRVEARDFLIAQEDLKLVGIVETLPARGDKITETTADGTTFTYEVLEIGSEPVWRYADEYRQQIRVHTKLIGST